MPFPLEEVFSRTQRQYFPKGMDTLEDVALASSQDIPIKKSWDYIASARRYLARMLLKRIRREGDNFFVKERTEINGYNQDYRMRLFKVLAIPFVEVWSESRISFESIIDGEFKYHVKFDNEFEKQSFEKFSAVEFDEKPETIDKTFPETQEIPNDLFDAVIGYEEAKDLFIRSLRSERPVHILLVGPPASAKTVFLLEIQRLSGSTYALGGSSSKAGLADLLFNRRPEFLLIDEIDKMNDEDYSVLLSLCENGIVAETKFGKLRETKLNTRVYAAANNIESIPIEVQSRFLVLKFPRYLPEQYREVVRNVLIKREKVEPSVADYIAERVSKGLETIDVRDSIKVSRLASSKEDIDRVLESISKYK
jgi:holliday junction DNA helicase RuvB